MNILLQRSVQFQEALVASFGSGVTLFDESPRLFASASACELSIEHATVLRLAFGAGAPHCATALLRLQYEALVRGAWLLHAASVDDIALLGAPLDLHLENDALSAIGAAAMLTQLTVKAPRELLQPLQQFDTVSRQALNGYARVALALDTVRNSNGLLHMAYRLIATLTGKKALVEGVTRVHSQFVDCVPERPPSG